MNFQASAAKRTNLAFAGIFDYVAKGTIIFQLKFILANFFKLIIGRATFFILIDVIRSS